MTTDDVNGDVTLMIAPLMVAALVKKAKEDGEVVAAASDIALAESVTKTVSTWSALSLSHSMSSLFFLCHLASRGLVTTHPV
jgi:hypothetical protein